MDAQAIIDTALCANAPILGLPEATQIYKDAIRSQYNVTTNLTQQQKETMMKLVDFPLIFRGGQTVVHDHPVLHAMRQVTRLVFEKECKILTTNERTLIVGSAAREIRQYISNPNIHFFVHGKENKDYDRIVRPALSDIVNALQKKAAKTDRRVYMEKEGFHSVRPVVKRYTDMAALFKDYVEVGNLPPVIHLEPVECNTLVFEDCHYNFSPQDYLKIFSQTGAQIAYGHGMMPMDLLYPDLPENNIYKFTTDGKYGVLTFRQGHSNGYRHLLKNWRTIFNNPVMSGGGVHLAVEIISRIGVNVVFKIYRCNHPETIVRTLGLPDSLRYVKLLDVFQSVNPRSGRAIRPLKYFTVREEEFLDTYNYLSSLEIKSVNFHHCTTYVRRRMGGISLVTKEILAAWDLPKSRVRDFCMVVTLLVYCHHEKNSLVLDNIAVTSVWERFRNFLVKVGRFAIYPLALLYDWIMQENLTNKLVLYPNSDLYQTGTVSRKPGNEDFNVGLYTDFPNCEDRLDCAFCDDCQGLLGEQQLRCGNNPLEEVELAMSEKQLADFKATLIDTDKDPPGLAEVKKKAAQSLPVGAFKHKARVHLIVAGPGCGKSYLIRKLADEKDLILAPFTKLKPDYENLDGPDGKYNLLFKTAHRAMSTRGCRRMFVDEFTSLPYEFLACVAHNNGCEEIFLVGDPKQTRVREPEEGLYIGNHMDLEGLHTHTLVKNFRNPRDVVAVLNKTFGYQMEATSKIRRSIKIVDVDKVPQHGAANVMVFSHKSGEARGLSEKCTVRSNQGGTCSVSVLYATILDAALLPMEELQIVAISRHVKELIIVSDGCAEAKGFIEKLGLCEEFYNNMEEHLKGTEEKQNPPKLSEKFLDEFYGRKEENPPQDESCILESVDSGLETSPGGSISDITFNKVVCNSTFVAEKPKKIAKTQEVKLVGCDFQDCPEVLGLNFSVYFKEFGKEGFIVADSNPSHFDLTINQVQRKWIEENISSVQNDSIETYTMKNSMRDALQHGRRSVEVFFLAGGPGTGKSSAGKKVSNAKVFKNAESYPIFSLVGNNKKRDTLVFDDFYNFPYEVIFALILYTGALKVLFIGDPKVCKVRKLGCGGTHPMSVFKNLKINYKMRNNYKYSEDVVRVINRLTGHKMRPRSEKLSTIVVLDEQNSRSLEAQEINFTGENEAFNLTSLSKMRFDEVRLHLRSKDCDRFSMVENQIKAFTKHTETMFLTFDDGDAARSIRDKLKSEHDAYNLMQTWFHFPELSVRAVDFKDEDVETVNVASHPSCDSYLVLPDLFPAIATDPDILAMNYIDSARVVDEFKNGCVNPDKILVPVNARGNTKNLTKEYTSIGAGMGNHFGDKRPMQELKIASERYSRIEHPISSDDRDKFIRESVDEYFVEHMDTTKAVFDDCKLQEITNAFLKNVTDKHYVSSFKGTGGFDNDKGVCVRFTVKDIFKPKFCPDTVKPGQGILAWSTDLCMMYCSVFRLMGKIISDCEKEHVVTPAYKSEKEFLHNIRKVVLQVPDVADNGFSDGIEFDCTQGETTQGQEKYFYQKLNVSDGAIEHYFRFRKNYLVLMSFGVIRAAFVKASGEPGTLVNNGIVSKVNTNFVLRGIGPVMLVYQGDDNMRRQCSLRVDEHRLARLKSLTSLRMKFKISSSVEFCGFTMVGGHCVPDIYRKANKIIAASFRDEKHFCEYQCSVRNYLDLVAEIGETIVVSCNAVMHKTSVDQMEGVLDSLKSISHIKFSQLQQIAEVRKNPPYIPTSKTVGSLRVMDPIIG